MQIGRGGVVFTRLDKAEGAGTQVGKALQGAADAASPAEATPTDARGSDARRPNSGGGGGRGGAGGGKEKAEVVTNGGNKKAETAMNGGEGSGVDQALETMQYDRMAIAYLSLLLLPLVVGYSAKKLVMDEHAGWYSWALQSLTVRLKFRVPVFFLFFFVCHFSFHFFLSPPLFTTHRSTE